MGFFKTIGSKLKRAISLKNVVRTVTGNFSAVGKDILRVSTTSAPKKVNVNPIQKTSTNSTPVFNSSIDKSIFNLPANTTIPPMIQSILEVQGNAQAQRMTESLAGIPAVQDTNSFLSGVFIKSLWLKYKTMIIGIASVLLVFILLKKFVFSSSSKGGVRKS